MRVIHLTCLLARTGGQFPNDGQSGRLRLNLLKIYFRKHLVVSIFLRIFAEN